MGCDLHLLVEVWKGDHPRALFYWWSLLSLRRFKKMTEAHLESDATSGTLEPKTVDLGSLPYVSIDKITTFLETKPCWTLLQPGDPTLSRLRFLGGRHRNYRLFEILAGVRRSYGLKAVWEYGLSPYGGGSAGQAWNITPSTRKLIEEEDLHSITKYTLSELSSFRWYDERLSRSSSDRTLWWAQRFGIKPLPRSPLDGTPLTVNAFLGKEITAGIIRDLQTLQELDQHGQGVRLILGFDS